MNKKRLSVVMAGAMLASAVAPVMAAEVQKSEVSANELGLLMDELRTLVTSKTFSDDSRNNPGELADGTTTGLDLRGQSVYAIYVNGRNTFLDANSTQNEWQNVFNDLGNGDKIEVYSKGFKEVDGKVLGYDVTPEGYAKFTPDKLKAAADEINKLVYDASNTQNGNNGWGTHYNLLKVDGAEYDKNTGRLTVEFKGDVTVNGQNFNTMVFDTNSDVVDFEKYIDATGKENTIDANVTPGDFYGFGKDEDAKIPAGYTDIASSVVREITITAGGYDLSIDELYDGLMLTEKGHDFFTAIKEARKMGRKVVIRGNYNNKRISLNGVADSGLSDAIRMYDGKGKFTIEFGEKGKLAKEVYTITGTNEANLERLAQWMIKPLARVDILAGDNRFETAVKVAKEYANLTSNTVTGKHAQGDINIVLVNGNALVDGLAASPLAASKSNKVYDYDEQKYNQKAAPILLTNSDSLPKETKAYLKEILSEVKIGHLNDVTINLVGGETVLERGLERELKSLGFKVERFGGDNREETSLEVAKEINNSTDKAFVVGADGEADAMSIAAVAAEKKTPIVVAKKGGISEEALYELRDQYVTVIGGEAVVSKSEYNAIKAEAKGVQRIFGSNRQETNAEIISKYYKKASATEGFVGPAENVIVAKDGRTNKTELVDALAAANMAAAKNAPIVLATDKLSKSQGNVLNLNAVNTKALYQVGHGVSRDVVKAIAKTLGLTNYR